jgi:PTH1 family peptidyl-tRNA hydrolase
MKLVAGLGNPGQEYRGTRHNVGFDVVDRLAAAAGLEFQMAPGDALMAKWRREDDAVLFVKPLTYMNRSGEAVAAIGRYLKIALPDLLVVCDDVNLPLGRLRARASGTEGGHNGLRSIAEQLGTVDYARLRVGVGRGDARRDLADHVLARFDAEEAPVIEAAVLRAGEAVRTWLDEGLTKMMNRFNRVEDNSQAEDVP